MEHKKRYKLYKSGKLWCCAAIAFAGFTIGTAALTGTGHADTTIPVSQTTGTSTSTGTTTTSSTTDQPVKNQMPATTPTTANDVNANNGYLDHYSLSTDQQGQTRLNVSGWQATGHSTSQPYRYVIVYDNSSQQEIARQAITPQRRDDVQNAYPDVAGSDYAGFNANILLPNAASLAGHSISVISRYSSDPLHGEGNRLLVQPHHHR